MEHIDRFCSSESQLYLISICSITILGRVKDITRNSQPKFERYQKQGNANRGVFEAATTEAQGENEGT